MYKFSKLAAALIVGSIISVSAIAAGETFVKVNGVAVSQSVANVFINEQKAQGAPDSPELKKAVREELIRRQLLVQEAKKAGLDKKPDVAAQAETAREALFIRAFIQAVSYTHLDVYTRQVIRHALDMRTGFWIAKFGGARHAVQQFLFA